MAADNNYDFHYSGETNMIVFAAENDDYYSLMIQADAARTIDLSGGTRCIEIIKFQKCRKMSRIIWPFDTGRIRAISIYGSETILKLDLTPLYNLESLSIVDCPSLTMLIGLPSHIKTINLYNTGINVIDLRHIVDIKTLNLHTRLDNLKVIGEHRNYLQHVMIKAEDKCHLQCNLTNCPILTDVYIDAENADVKLNIKNSPALKELTVIANDKSSVYGLAGCKQIKYAHSSLGVTLKDIDPVLLKQRIEKNSAEMKYNASDLAKEFTDKQLQFQIDASAHNPHVDDKETVIQHISSRREFEQGLGAMLSLLSHPMEHVIEISQNDLRKMKKLSSDSRPQFLVESTLTPFYILGSNLSPHPGRLIKNARTTHSSQSPIEDCMASPDTILLVTDRDLTKKQFLMKFIHLIRNPLYKHHTVFLAGRLDRFDQYIPGLSRRIIPIDLASQIETEALFNQKFTADVNAIYDALQLSSNRAEAIAAAAEFTAIMNSYSINVETTVPQPSKNWLAADSQDVFDKEVASSPEPMLDIQQPVEGDAEHTEEPLNTEGNADSIETATQKAAQLVIDPTPDQFLLQADKTAKEPAVEPINDQVLIDANKKAERLVVDPTPDQCLLQANKTAKERNQEPINEQVLIEAKKKSRQLVIDPTPEQLSLQAGKTAKEPNLDPINEQVLIEANKKAKELVIDPTPEQILLQANKTAKERHLEPINEQVLIEAKKKSKQLVIDPTPEQLLLQAGKTAKEPNLELINEQVLIEANKKAKELVIDPTPEQILLQANKIAKERHLEHINEQVLIEAKKKSKQLVIDPTPDQFLLQANKNNKERNLEPIDDQILINANKEFNESANREKLLTAARNLAIATQQMVDAAIEKDISPGNELKRAEVLIKTVNRELDVSACKSIKQEELFAVAKTLADGLKALADVCRNEITNKPAQSPAQTNTKDNVKKNE